MKLLNKIIAQIRAWYAAHERRAEIDSLLDYRESMKYAREIADEAMPKIDRRLAELGRPMRDTFAARHPALASSADEYHALFENAPNQSPSMAASTRRMP